MIWKERRMHYLATIKAFRKSAWKTFKLWDRSGFSHHVSMFNHVRVHLVNGKYSFCIHHQMCKIYFCFVFSKRKIKVHKRSKECQHLELFFPVLPWYFSIVSKVWSVPKYVGKISNHTTVSPPFIISLIYKNTCLWSPEDPHLFFTIEFFP